MRRLALATIVPLLCLAAATSGAKPSSEPSIPAGEARFLGKNPHGPLTVVRENRIDTPEEGACRAWGPKGSEWRSLGKLGQVVGKAKVTARDRYDVTNCDELTLERSSGADGVGVYVDGSYDPAPLAEWTPEGDAEKELDALIAKRDRALPPAGDRDDGIPYARATLTWKTPGGVGFAVVGGRALTVLRRDAGVWKVLHQRMPAKDEVFFKDMFTPFVALDMNRDGGIEIVVHVRHIDAYEDVTLTPDGPGYREIAAGIHGAFA